MQLSFISVRSGGSQHFECEYAYKNTKTEMRIYMSNFRNLHMQFWPSLNRQLAAVLDGITIYISVPPLKIKGQRLFEVHAVIKKH